MATQHRALLLSALLALAASGHAGAETYEMGEFYHDLADVPGGAKLIRIGDRLVQAMGAGTVVDPGLASLPTVPSGKVSAAGGTELPGAAAAIEEPPAVAALAKPPKPPSPPPPPPPPPPPMVEFEDDTLLLALPKEWVDKADALGGDEVDAARKSTAPRYRLPAALPAERSVRFEDLRPQLATKYRHRFYYQIPPNPRAVLLLVHGCAHSGAGFWPQSAACGECRGLPEQLQHTLQALRRGYAVIAVSSLDRATGCWSWGVDSEDLVDLMNEWLHEQRLNDLPLYTAGISSGAAFVLKFARLFETHGIMSEALGVDEDTWGIDKMDRPYPATIFVSMDRDKEQRAKIQRNWEILKQKGVPVALIKVYPRKVYPTYFSDRFGQYITVDISKKITAALLKMKMIGKDGYVFENPRYNIRPWLSELQKLVPELGGSTVADHGRSLPEWPPRNGDMRAAAVWSLMNLAFADHEIVSDYAGVAFRWWESGGKANLRELLDKYTTGKPSKGVEGASTKRKTLEELSAGFGGAAVEQELQLQRPAAADLAAKRPSRGMLSFDGAFAAGAAVVLLAVGIVLSMVQQRRRAAAAPAGLLSGVSAATHPVPAGSHRLASLVPGVKERFAPELTEVVEQTGSPYSARRRVRTAFNASGPDSRSSSPQRSPKKRHGGM